MKNLLRSLIAEARFRFLWWKWSHRWPRPSVATLDWMSSEDWREARRIYWERWLDEEPKR